MIKLGTVVKDKVTGLEGVAENRATYLYGCDRYCVQPKAKEDGTLPEAIMVDEPQLAILTQDVVMEPLPEPRQIVKLGQLVYDPVSGREGTVTGRAVYLNGCSRVLVQPKFNPEVEGAGDFWVYEEQVELREKIVKEQSTGKTGGPAPKTSKW